MTKVIMKIGAQKVGIRLSPYGIFGDVSSQFEGIDDFYTTLASKLSQLGILYIHLVDHHWMGALVVPSDIKKLIRKNFKGTLILF